HLGVGEHLLLAVEVVLADPDLVPAERVGGDDLLQVLVVRITRQAPRVLAHREQAESHGAPSFSCSPSQYAASPERRAKPPGPPPRGCYRVRLGATSTPDPLSRPRSAPRRQHPGAASMKFAHMSHIWRKPSLSPAQRFAELWRELEVCDA